MNKVPATEENAYRKELEKYLLGRYNVKLENANDEQIFRSLAGIVNDKLYEIREVNNANASNRNAKAVHYVSIEFLVGKSLKSHLFNLGLEEVFRDILKKAGKSIDDVYDKEDESCLGNGGLGRLASCFMDSLASEKYPAFGHCINYDYGLFKQKIIDGNQFELPDEWALNSEVWLSPRGDESVIVRFGGRVSQCVGKDGKFSFEYSGTQDVEAYPYDMLVSGFGGKKVNILKLWSARSLESIDTKKFSQGEYVQAMANKDDVEAISKVLYPSDNHEKGKSLRLKQEYFLASAVAQFIVNNHIKQGKDLHELSNSALIHINDTHPVLIIPELMRILMDEKRFGWEESYNIVSKMVSYTNHTLLSESLAKKELNLLDRYIPRIAMIIRELDRRLTADLIMRGVDKKAVYDMAIIQNGIVNMTNLAVSASYKINGVSEVHSEILKNSLLKSYSSVFPEKFINITNGVTHRRWLSMANPSLDNLIKSLIGDDYYTDPEKLSQLENFVGDERVIDELQKIKTINKVEFAKYLLKTQGILINPNSRFDVQVKRIHEYKRQLLNCLKIIYLYGELLSNPSKTVTPQTFIFAGKAASGYYMAKRIIKLIYCLSQEIDKNKVISKKLKVVFVENYSVTLAEKLMPATDVTEQISLAGREASGTGNMKAVMNGALMLHTSDGANIEIAERCGEKNSFEFGLTPDQVDDVWQKGYDAMSYYKNSAKIQMVIKMLKTGFNGESFDDIASYLLGQSANRDIYMCLADFDSYIDAHERMDKVYKNKKNWFSKTLHNISCMGYFSSDRSIEEYVNKVWKLKRIN